MSAPPTALAPDLAAGLRRLKLAAVRRLAPEVLAVAKAARTIGSSSKSVTER